MSLNIVSITVAAVFLFVAACYDWRWQRIPNWLNVSAAVAAIAVWGSQSQWVFVFKNLWLGLGIGVLFYVIGLVGAGDAKALAALGGLVGTDAAMLTVAFAFIILALWAAPKRIWKLGFKGFLKSEWQGVWYYLIKRRLHPAPEECPPEIEKVPLAPFFLPGFVIAMLLSWGWFGAVA